MENFKKKAFHYIAGIKIFGHLFLVMEPKIFYYKFLEKIGKQKKANEFGFRSVKKWASFVMKATKSNITVKGLEKLPKNGPVLFTPNHQSYADIPLLLHILKDYDLGFLMKEELKQFFAVEQICPIIKCVPINADNPRDSMKGLRKTAEQIQSGLSMVIFPEGKRIFSNTPEEFKNGAFKVVQKTGVTVVPIHLHNVHKIYEGSDFLITPADIHVTILDPIETTNMTRADVKLLHDKVYNLIMEQAKKYND